MLERKASMGAFAAAFIALPGGLGTLDELFEMLTWKQIVWGAQPCRLLRRLVAWGAHAVEEGLVRPGHKALLLAYRDVSELLGALASCSVQDIPLT